MSSPAPHRQALEELWRQRVKDARLRLDFALDYVTELQRQISAADTPHSDTNFALRKARRAESLALAEYGRVVKIYADLTVHGIMPDESE